MLSDGYNALCGITAVEKRGSSKCGVLSDIHPFPGSTIASYSVLPVSITKIPPALPIECRFSYS
jgi:hypothetical protein